MMKISERISRRAKKIKDNLVVLHLAFKDQRTPWFAKALVLFIVAYALSPVDLIPDFIPVLGYLDDMLLLPVLIFFALKLIPAGVISECRVLAQSYEWKKKKSLVGLAMVVLVWLIIFLVVKYAVSSL